ncbi:MAG TPA: hypothetical protein VF532_14145 [Candidatus Angelobacter sp.]
MNTVFSCLVERRDFGDLLSPEGVRRLELDAERDLRSVLSKRLPRELSILAVWAQNPRENDVLPALLVCDDGNETDWAAWITTFGAKIRPFSAFMRLVARSKLETLTLDGKPSLKGFTWPVAGLILGEVLAASGLPDKSLETMPANACESTLSFSIFRAAAAHPRFALWSQVIESWEAVRQLTRQHTRLIDSALVARVCSVIITSIGLAEGYNLVSPKDLNLITACRELLRTPARSPLTLKMIPQFSSIEERMHGSREDRVIAFSELLHDLERSSPADSDLTSFALGYLASRIAPGTIQHSSVLRPAIQKYPTALLWYGFCAGVPSLEGRLQNPGWTPMEFPASARRIARDLLRSESLLDAPSSDIAFLELLALARTGGDPLKGLITSTQGTATIELAPAISTVVNVGSKVESEDAARSAKGRNLLIAMGESLEQITAAYNDLVRTEIPESRQRVLFPPKKRKL